MVHHYFGCGHCDQCRSGWTQMCRLGSTAMGGTAPGSHTERIAVPLQSVIPMPDGLSFLAAAAISCGTGNGLGSAAPAAAARGRHHRDLRAGPGGAGGHPARSAPWVPGSLRWTSPRPAWNAPDSSGRGKSSTPPRSTSVADAIRALTDGRGVAKSLETSGASTAARGRARVLDLWGAACWVGIGSTIDFELTEHLFKQVRAMTSWTLSIPAMAECASFVVEREIDVDSLYTDQLDARGSRRGISSL